MFIQKSIQNSFCLKYRREKRKEERENVSVYFDFKDACSFINIIFSSEHTF